MPEAAVMVAVVPAVLPASAVRVAVAGLAVRPVGVVAVYVTLVPVVLSELSS
jgi:hypothetical protein